ncbi:MAG: nitroreductase [Xanthobacteraceae bacterium]|nr:nitroreductase [Xanthobacteraceae bacterium]
MTPTLNQIVSSRFSCRAFVDRQVPRQTIEKILAVAQRTPSWCNTQPWQLILTSGNATRKFRSAFAEYLAINSELHPDIPFPRQYHGIYQDRRRESGFQLYAALGIEKGDRTAYERQTLKNFSFFGAPHVAIVTTPEELGAYGAIDCGAYIGVFTLAACELGVATIPQAALAGYSAFIREYFSIPQGRKVVAGISFGYADEKHPANSFRTNRSPLNAVVDWKE